MRNLILEIHRFFYCTSIGLRRSRLKNLYLSFRIGDNIICFYNMGILRLFLAYIVILFHSPEGILPRISHPALAVQCFYVISGFYMQLVINKYYNANNEHWKMDFYKSRFIRIFALYYVFLSITLIFFSKGNE